MKSRMRIRSALIKRRKQKGAALVEFAIVLPLLLLVVFGIIEFSLAIYDKAVITNASREAARAGIVLASPKPTTAQIQQVATNYCSSYLVSLGSSANTCPAANVSVSGAQGTFGSPVTVTVSYTFAPIGLGKLIAPLTGPLTMSATTTMNNE
ncbi:TadE/TadG family type IV pilus assembly protein [Trinickia dinghuensis]|uniref:Pilus assembly protein n=1 Tax=Trinickia dinghuensis TaxID=2291023 RepID=A0A3D8JPS9_9BURK|nr:TadE/TadG family type IV pilus assembly protein [Trinickia dinghuensis]RDU94554.1 pilus assembly protein [Trinickia dinghuensis]